MSRKRVWTASKSIEKIVHQELAKNFSNKALYQRIVVIRGFVTPLLLCDMLLWVDLGTSKMAVTKVDASGIDA